MNDDEHFVDSDWHKVMVSAIKEKTGCTHEQAFDALGTVCDTVCRMHNGQYSKGYERGYEDAVKKDTDLEKKISDLVELHNKMSEKCTEKQLELTNLRLKISEETYLRGKKILDQVKESSEQRMQRRKDKQ